jgi:hypothetical protein
VLNSERVSPGDKLDMRSRRVSKKEVRLAAPPEPKLTFEQKRAAAYPPLNEFAEALTEKELGDDTKWRRYLKTVRRCEPAFQTLGVRVDDMSDGAALARAGNSLYNPLLDRCVARVTPEGNILGGAIFRNYTGVGGSVNMHVASFGKGWMTRMLIFMAFDYAYNQLGVKKIFGNIPSRTCRAKVRPSCRLQRRDHRARRISWG